MESVKSIPETGDTRPKKDRKPPGGTLTPKEFLKLAYRRIHFHISPHASPTSLATIDYACAFTKAAGAALDVTIPQVDVQAPSSWLAGKMIAGIAQGVEDMISAKRTELEIHLKQRCEPRR